MESCDSDVAHHPDWEPNWGSKVDARHWPAQTAGAIEKEQAGYGRLSPTPGLLLKRRVRSSGQAQRYTRTLLAPPCVTCGSTEDMADGSMTCDQCYADRRRVCELDPDEFVSYDECDWCTCPADIYNWGLVLCGSCGAALETVDWQRGGSAGARDRDRGLAVTEHVGINRRQP